MSLFFKSKEKGVLLVETSTQKALLPNPFCLLCEKDPSAAVCFSSLILQNKRFISSASKRGALLFYIKGLDQDLFRSVAAGGGSSAE